MSTERRLHFISGLPRSGSTLLAALLRQNPAFHANVSSPVAVMLCGLQQALSGKSEFHSLVSNEKRRAVFRGIVRNYFDDIDSPEVIFDTNRLWCSKLDLLSELFPAAKVVCCVRSLGWIVDSFERAVRKNCLEPSRMFNHEAFGTVYTRTDALLHPTTGSVGASYNGVREAFYGEQTARLVVVRYESLASESAATMAKLYDFIGEPPYTHDFDNAAFESPDFDHQMGIRGLHSVRPQVRLVRREPLLPPDLWSRFERSAFWDQPDANPRNVLVI